ncbi:hypothetical protein [Paraburkholderia phenazinium]|jgi:hypothetical protein|uniref:Uncharacterized protein n=1 Tax=Paraburkholderia phenazinium TaxID=60549 RepID=A0A1N6JJL9_9BURK|nr:hypothetical protein [Paraburkholderia phenazinium]SIO44562.1 hypothetical protein SAMN05444168_4543 [Paraburkholderia phenazinium]
MKRIDAKRSAQAGQAMAEFLVSMIAVMSVLFLGIVMLGKFNDVRNRTLMGSRYVAWERTVWTDNDPSKNYASDPATTEGWSTKYGSSALAASKADTEIEREVIQRFMAGDSTTPTSADRTQTQLPAVRPAMWDDYSGQPLLASTGDVLVSTGVSNDPSTSQTSSANVPFGSIQTAAGNAYGAKLSVPTRTTQFGTLSVSIAQNNETLKRLWPKNGSLPAFSGLTFTDTNVLMTNTWVPEGTDNAKAVFNPAVPAANAALVPSSTYMGLQKYAPEISTLQFGRIQQDVVPGNRLSP